jgi:uncharacterized protein (UPF0147 family)
MKSFESYTDKVTESIDQALAATAEMMTDEDSPVNIKRAARELVRCANDIRDMLFEARSRTDDLFRELDSQ